MMFDNPFAVMRYIIILSAVAWFIYKIQFLLTQIRNSKMGNSGESDKIKSKVEELLSKRNISHEMPEDEGFKHDDKLTE